MKKLKRRIIVYGILIIIVVYISIDFYNQNKSEKLDWSLNVNTINTADKSVKKNKDFILAIIENMNPEIRMNRYFNLWDYFFPEKLEGNQLDKFYTLFEDSTNFGNGETTFDQIDYVIRFYYPPKGLVFKMWVGLENRMVYTIPVLTNIKGGLLTNKSVVELKTILEK